MVRITGPVYRVKLDANNGRVWVYVGPQATDVALGVINVGASANAAERAFRTCMADALVTALVGGHDATVDIDDQGGEIEGVLLEA